MPSPRQNQNPKRMKKKDHEKQSSSRSEARDPLIAEKAHTELTQIEKEIAELEEQWLELEHESQDTAGG